VDERPELDEIYSNVTTSSDQTSPLSRAGQSPTLSTGVAPAVTSEESAAVADVVSWSPQSLYHGSQAASPSKRRRTNDSASTQSLRSPLQPEFLLYHVESEGPTTPSLEHESTIESLLRAADLADHGFHQTHLLSSPIQDDGHPYLSASQTPTNSWPHVNVQEACLMRYFVDNLACWVSFSLETQFQSITQRSNRRSVRPVRSRTTFCSHCASESYPLPCAP